jgi:YHS domain-containing protein
MKIARNLLAALAVASGLFAASVAMAGTETNVSSGLTAKGPGLAVHGYDVVAYFTEARPTRGRAKYSTVYKDATYRFASEEHLDAFEDDPERYLPQYGGYCAYGVAVGAKFDGDPQLWRIVDGKLYLNLNEDIQATWHEDISGYIKKGDRNWTMIAGKTPEELS